MAHYSIKDLEKLSGIKAHTLRIWEKRYNLVEPKRTSTNIRYYDDDALRKVLNIALLNRNGLKISHIAELDESEISCKVTDLAIEHPDIANQVDNLVSAMVEFDEKKFDLILNNSTVLRGFEETVLHLIYPFFEKVGVLWQTGVINPAQEHFISNLIRQKLIVAIDKLDDNMGEDTRRFIMFLPEGELHEISLLFFYFLAKKRGFNVLYLGQSVPFKDLSAVIKVRKCDFLLTSFSSTFNGLDISEYIRNMADTFPELRLFFSSFDYENMKHSFPKNTTRIKNAFHFTEILSNI
ncbi:MAG: MerR family transcriptional regulator [Bacteroidales bacterium]|nr:MerR family transcriptional regulator [Bacteroidales bacterium]MCB9013542.1 MerR family transcriptional regulator [Bacteroidales bacterium]